MESHLPPIHISQCEIDNLVMNLHLIKKRIFKIIISL